MGWSRCSIPRLSCSHVFRLSPDKALAQKHPGRFVWFISADLAKPESAPIKQLGGSTRADYASLYGDMSANSCNNALNRDPSS